MVASLTRLQDAKTQLLANLDYVEASNLALLARLAVLDAAEEVVETPESATSQSLG